MIPIEDLPDVTLTIEDRLAQVVVSWLAANEDFSILEDVFGFKGYKD